MTVDASRRIIAQVAVCTEYVEEKESTSHQRAQQNEAQTLLSVCQSVDETGNNTHNLVKK